MRVEVLPSVLSGRVAAPGSKSDAQRIVACALLARGKTVISAFPDNDDCNAALQVAQDLGAVVTRTGDVVTIPLARMATETAQTATERTNAVAEFLLHLEEAEKQSDVWITPFGDA